MASPLTQLPLSHAQRRIWLLEQVYPASALGNLSGLLHVDGPVDAERLAAAVDGFVRETASVRLQLLPGPGLPRQFVAEPPRERTPVLDFGRAADPLGAARAWASTQARTPRASLEGPLADFAVLAVGGGRALLYARVHHLIADAASLALFSRAVNQRYLGEPVDVSGDFAASLAEEQAYLASEKAAADRDAWVETLARCQPSFRTRPGGSPSAVRHAFELGAAQWAALAARLRARGTTFNRFLAAAAAGALHALTGQTDVTVGAYTHGRWTRPSLRTFGMFVGTLPVPVAVPAQGGLDALLEETGRALQRGLRASRYPFDLALDQAGRRGELVYDSLVSFQSEGHHPTFAGHPAHIEWLFSGAETHPLVVHAADRAQHGTLSVELDLRLDAFPEGAPAALAEGLEQWLREAAAAVGTGASLRALSVVGARDRARQDARNATAAPVPPSALERALASLRTRASEVVLHDARGACTGNELLALAGGVAQALGDVGPGDVVALALPRGRGLLAAMLAVGARGATYLPTDGAWPPERLRGVLADSGARLVVHEGPHWPALREHPLPVVDVAAVSPAPLRPVPVPREAAAYLIYTSGTSGRPKGVRVGVGALANFVGAMESALPWAKARTVLGVTSPSFDIFALETWLPLATGVTVCFADGDSAALDVLAQVLARTPCDVVQLTPSRLQLFLHHPGVRAALAKVELLLVGGEALPDALRAEARAALPGARLFNLYGPTETTVWSTTAELTDASRVHVGLPIANTTVAVVSPSGFELPSGLPGELWLGGAGVALGYHARAELTAERFVPHPRLGRMYRTGDLARWASDGVLEHLGRLDAQVKIAGHRVELQELEALLLECPGVRQAVVVVARGPKGDPVLMAHVVGEAAISELERALRQHLPAALMPRAIELHAQLPVLPSGKVDRTALAARALPVSGQGASALPAAAAPLQEAWTQVLGAATDPDESFFALGGTSVHAVQLAAAVEARVGRKFDLGAFFAEPTLRALAAQLASAPALAPRAPALRAGPSLEQQRIALALELAGPQLGPRDYHLCGVVAVHGPLEVAALERALQTLAARHEALRTALVREGGALSLAPRPAQVPLLRHQGAPTPEALLDVLVSPMALEQGAFLRAAVQPVSPTLHWLAVDVHHAAADARSLELLLEELARLLAGEALPAAPPFFSLAHDEDTRPGAEAFWREELTRHPEAYAASREASPGPVGLHSERLDAGQVAALAAAAAQLGVTTVDLALSALAFALEPWDARPERAVLLTVAGRTSEAAWRAVGPFARAVPVRLPAGGALGASEHAREVSRRAKAVLAGSAVSVSALTALKGDPSPLADVLVAWPPATVPSRLGAGALTLERLDLPLGESLVPLTLVANPTPSGLSLHFSYQGGSWQAHEVAAVASAFRAALGVLCHAPARSWAQVPFVPVDEPAPAAPRALDALAQVYRHVERTPDALAVSLGGVAWSYRALWDRACALARSLGARGVAPGATVAVVCPPSPELTAAVLGVLEAQAAFVLLDPAHPLERQRALAAQARCVALVLPEGVTVDLGLPVLRVGSPALEAAPAPRAAPPAQLAYVVFTSGTTAQPKAVGLERGQLAAQLHWLESFFAEAPAMRHTFLVSPSVDVAVHQTFAPLIRGDALCFAPADAALAPQVLLDFVREQRIDVVDSVPSLLDHVLTATSAERPLRCRYLCFGGDTLTPELWARVTERAQVERIINYYGPTETCLNATALDAPATARFTRVPIGRPCTGYSVDVLDPWGRRLPVGALGELVVGGPGVARGYLDAPAATAERFVPDPARPGGRRYRTGDLGRATPSGLFEFAGRRDTQVKVRGFRVELGEVEAAVRALPGVRDCAADVRTEGRARSLVAFVVPADGFDARQSLERLRGKVPPQLVPARLVSVAALPVTAAGKLDRKAVARLELPAAAERVVSELSATERRVAAVWGRVLGQAPVSPEDDFYSLGGDSLMAAQLADALRAELQRELPLRWVLEAPELRAFCARLDAAPVAARSAGAGQAPSTDALSPSQRRLWFLQQLAPDGAGYHLAGAMRASRGVDVELLRRAAAAVAANHESLRTRFPSTMGVPRREVGGDGLPVTAVDVGAGPLAPRLQAFATLPFDLTGDAPGRVGLFREADGGCVLALVLHHLVGDARSLEVVLEELSRALEALERGAPVTLPAAPRFADYAAAEVAFDASPEAAALTAAWASHVEGCSEPLELPSDLRRPAQPTGAGRQTRLEVPGALSQRLRELARAERTTPYAVWLAGFTALLARLTGRSEFLVGVPVHNRLEARWSRLVGSLVNTLPLRAAVALARPFAEHLRATAAEVAWGLEHQRVSFERLVERAAPTRDLSRTPLYSVMFTGEPPLEAGLSLAGRALTPVPLELGIAKVDLSVGVHEAQGHFVLEWEYGTELFEAATIARWHALLLQLLAAAVDGPGAALARLPFGSAEDLALEAALNRPSAPAASATVVAGVFAQAERTPDAPAVLGQGVSVSYRALVTRAHQVAHALRSRGVRPGERVVVALPRGAELYAAWLGVLEAGAAYVPLEVDFPADRAAQILEAAEPRLAIAAEALSTAGVPTLREREWAALLVAQPTTALGVPLHAEALAYLSFTSGSTGKPKGVAVPHRALASYAWATVERYGLGARDRLVQFSSVNFDGSVEEVYCPLLAGGAVVLKHEAMLDPREYLRACEEHQATFLTLTTAYWVELAQAVVDGRAALPSCVRAVAIGGEKAPVATVRAWLSASGAVPLFNEYGPTETTVVAATAALGEVPPERWLHRQAPLGVPLARTALWVVDERFERRPVGAPGELCIGGPQLARGYVGNAAETADRFRPDPFSGVPGARLYRTGDTVVRWADGQVEYVGRNDAQVKLRGFRIELGEVEARLGEHPLVREAVVTVHGEGSAARLVAHVVLRGALDAATLLSFARARLPEPMVPRAVLFHERLPLSPVGKVDRKRLPAPPPEGPAAPTRPLSPQEAPLAEVLRALLKVSAVGPDDDFFALGGHSLLAVQAAAQLEKQLGRPVPVRLLFEHPTVAALATALAAAAPAQAPIRRVDRAALSRGKKP